MEYTGQEAAMKKVRRKGIEQQRQTDAGAQPGVLAKREYVHRSVQI
jgi:hypothetical protein